MLIVVLFHSGSFLRISVNWSKSKNKKMFNKKMLKHVTTVEPFNKLLTIVLLNLLSAKPLHCYCTATALSLKII